nr:hypothetical protein GCM10020093_004520 [Planobispora longispora]
MRSATLKPFAEAFAEENGIKAEIVVVAQNQQQTFTTASQAGKGPDVIVGAHDWIGNLVQNGLIDPVQMTEEQLSGYVDVARKAVTYGGQVYGVPYAVESLALFRNTDLAPDAPESFEELVATGKKLKAAGKVEEIVGYPVSQQNGQSGDTYHLYPSTPRPERTCSAPPRPATRTRPTWASGPRSRSPRSSASPSWERRARARSSAPSPPTTPLRPSTRARPRSWSPGPGGWPTPARRAWNTTSHRFPASRTPGPPGRSSACSPSSWRARAGTRRSPRSSSPEPWPRPRWRGRCSTPSRACPR